MENKAQQPRKVSKQERDKAIMDIDALQKKMNDLKSKLAGGSSLSIVDVTAAQTAISTTFLSVLHASWD